MYTNRATKAIKNIVACIFDSLLIVYETSFDSHYTTIVFEGADIHAE